MKLRRGLAVGAVAIAAAVGVFLAPSAAWADTNPGLHQAGQDILASSPGYNGTDCNGVPAAANEDIWVFVWPGNAKVGTITTVTITWKKADDSTTSLTYPADGTLITNGTPKIAFVTPAGWRLDAGTSTVTGYTSHGVFNLTHTCAAKQPGDGVQPCTANDPRPECAPPPADDCITNPDQDKCNTDPCAVVGAPLPDQCTTTTTTTTTTTPPDTTTTTTTTPGLPVTGSSLTGILVAGVALIAAGGVTLFVMRRRRATEGQ